MRYQFVLITLALCLQITLLWTLGMRLDTHSGSVAIQPEKVITPQTKEVRCGSSSNFSGQDSKVVSSNRPQTSPEIDAASI